MSYQRYRRRRTTQKPRKFFKSYTNRRMYQLGRSVQYLKKAINVEYKEINNNVTLQPTTVWQFDPLTSLAVGDDKTNRDGRSIRPRFLTGKMLFQKHATATQTFIRAIIFRDTSSNGVVPDIDDILQNATTFPLTSVLNKDYTKRFRILMDRTYALNADKPNFCLKINRKLWGHTEYSGITANQTDLSTGHYYLAFVSNESTNSPTFQYFLRVSFVDN